MYDQSNPGKVREFTCLFGLIRKPALVMLLIIGFTVAGCSNRDQDNEQLQQPVNDYTGAEVVIEGYDLSFFLPVGWIVSMNDAMENHKGALYVLKKQNSGESYDPTICIWVGGYAQELASFFGIEPLMVMALITLSGDSAIHKVIESGSLDITMPYILTNQQTEHFFLHFVVSGLDTVIALTTTSDQNEKEVPISVTVAASRESIEENKETADRLLKHIKTQLAGSTETMTDGGE